MDIPEDVDVIAAFPSVAERLRSKGFNVVDLSLPLERVEGVLKELLEKHTVAVVLSGDPLFFGYGEKLKKAFPHAVVVPQVSYMQLAFAKMGRSWQNASFCSLHARPMESILKPLSDAGDYLFVFTDKSNTPRAIASFLLEAEVEVEAFWIFERLGLSGEKVSRLSLEDASKIDFGYPNCVVVEKRRHEVTDVFNDERYLSRRGLLTKSFVRGFLRTFFPGGGIFWDLGAGCGAVSITFSLNYELVFAVEKDKGALSLIKDNRRKFGRWNVKIVAERAEDVVSELPPPNGVFIGVGRKGFKDLFEVSLKRLKPFGVVAATFVTKQGIKEALEVSEKFGAKLFRLSFADYSEGLPEVKRPVWVLVCQKSI